MFDSTTMQTGIVIFLARICDVSIGTVRTIVTVQGRTSLAFILAVLEIMIWIMVAGTVINQVNERPILAVFYALGYAAGNVVGIKVEAKLAFGLIILRVICRESCDRISKKLRESGQPVTKFIGEGMRGPVNELYIVCRRRDLNGIIEEVKKIDDKAFYVIEQARSMSKVLRPLNVPLGGWRAISKRK